MMVIRSKDKAFGKFNFNALGYVGLFAITGKEEFDLIKNIGVC